MGIPAATPEMAELSKIVAAMALAASKRFNLSI